MWRKAALLLLLRGLLLGAGELGSDDTNRVWTPELVKRATDELVPRLKGSMHNIAGTASEQKAKQAKDGLREDAVVLVDDRWSPIFTPEGSPEDGSRRNRRYPREKMFVSVLSGGDFRTFFIEDTALRVADGTTGNITTVMDILKEAGVEPASNVLLDGINWKQNGKARSTLYLLVLEEVKGPQTKSGDSTYHQWLADFPAKLITVELSQITSGESLNGKGHIVKSLLTSEQRKMLLKLGGSATSMAVTSSSTVGRHHVYLAFGWATMDKGAPYFPHGLQDTSIPHSTRNLNGMFPLCQINKECKDAKYADTTAYIATMESWNPPLILWDVHVQDKVSRVSVNGMHHWKFKGGKFVKRWNDKSRCCAYYQARSAALYLHAKAWDKVHLQAVRDDSVHGVYLSFSSSSPHELCYTGKLQNCDACKNGKNGKDYRCIAGKNGKDYKPKNKGSCSLKQCSKAGKGAICKIREQSVKVKECTGIEMLSFKQSKLNRTAVAFRRIGHHAATGGELSDTLPLYGVSSDNIRYEHTGRRYVFMTTSKGALHSVDVTDGKLSVESKQGATIEPVVAAKGKVGSYENDQATIVGGVEGSNPVIATGHGYDIMMMTSFQRLWRFDAKQQVPCGNLMKFLLPSLRGWEAPKNGTVSQKQVVELRARISDTQAPLSPWTCELQKKSLTTFDDHRLFKYVACCYPSRGGVQDIACCSTKETETKATKDSQFLQQAMMSL